MANSVIRAGMIELLAGGDFTVAALANRLAISYSAAAKAGARAREEGEAHICGYGARGAAILRVGQGVDITPHAVQDPVAPVEDRHDASNAGGAKEHDVTEQAVEYFEMPDLLPGVKHFNCAKLRATLSTEACGDRFRRSNRSDPDVHADRYHACRRCPLGALHSGAGTDLNIGRYSGMAICGRCHRGATRLIGKHLCVSCYNRSRELRIGKNGKGTAPRNLARLDRRSITYRAGGVVKTRTIAETVDAEELIVAVLRDEDHAPQFGYRAPQAMDWLQGEEFDCSIPGVLIGTGVAATTYPASQ